MYKFYIAILKSNLNKYIYIYNEYIGVCHRQKKQSWHLNINARTAKVNEGWGEREKLYEVLRTTVAE